MNDQRRPRVDAIIAVHTAQRPVARAVRSVLQHTKAPVRVTVVIHNTEATPIRAHLDEFRDDPRMRIVEFSDGIPSPAGPMNKGLALADAEFTALLGSDDEFLPGALDRWLEMADLTGAAAVIAGLRFSDGVRVPQPPVRPRNRLVRHPVRDRLAYRSAPLGLISTSHFGDCRLTEGLPTGEDMRYSLGVWFSGERIVFDANDAGYVVHREGTDRVTEVTRDLATEWAALRKLLLHADDVGEEFSIHALRPAERLAIVLKLLRVQVLGSLALRGTSDRALSAGDLETLAETLRLCESTAPGFGRFLSLNESRLIQAATSGGGLERAARKWLKKMSFLSIWTGSLRSFLHPQAPLRYGVASLLLLRKR